MTTRVNLFNEWVTSIPVGNARMLGGSLGSDFVGFVTTITREILFRMS